MFRYPTLTLFLAAITAFMIYAVVSLVIHPV